MQRNLIIRSAMLVGLVSAGALVATSCLRDESTPTSAPPAIAARSQRSVTSVASPNVTAIQQRAADIRQRGLTPEEQARVASLKGTWAWVADLHHAAMQEAIHDPAVLALAGTHSNTERCAAQVRYMVKYSAEIEAHTGRPYASAAERLAAMKSLASQVGACRFAAPTSVFARVPVAFALRVGHFLTGTTRANAVTAAWVDYGRALAGGIYGANSLDDALGRIDAIVATASSDRQLSVADVSVVAGIADLARSSAAEWDAYFQTRESSVFLLSWLDWLADTYAADVNGCTDGTSSGGAAGCAAGAVGGSATSWF